MATDLTIPLEVSRAVIGSDWYHTFEMPERQTVESWARNAYKRASYGRSDREFPKQDYVGVSALLDVLRNVQKELVGAPTKTVKAVADYVTLLEKAADREKVLYDAKQKDEEEKQKVQAEILRIRRRKSESERRERPLTVSIEVRRQDALREIAEDYGLNWKDPQVRAAMIASFRHGVSTFRDVVNASYFQEVDLIADGEKEKLAENDKKLFARAREKVRVARELNGAAEQTQEGAP